MSTPDAKPGSAEPASIPPFAAHGAQPAAETGESRQEEVRRLAALLQSDAAPFEKDAACRRLAVIGTKEAVPALASLLRDETLSDIARFGLEPIPDSSVDEALREALGKVRGRPLIGVITSIGNRGDRKAVPELVNLLGDADEGVVTAAAMSLGKIGGQQAANALERALGRAPAAVADGCLLCAEALLADGRRRRAAALCDAVRGSDLPGHIVAAATRGAILARGGEGVALLVDLLKSDDEEMFDIGLRVARELPGDDVTQALDAERPSLPVERRDLLAQALRDRGAQ